MRIRFYKCEAEYCEGITLVTEASIQMDDATTIKEAEAELKQLVANDFSKEKKFTPNDIVITFIREKKMRAADEVASWLKL